MPSTTPLDLLSFNVKMLGRKSRKCILVSAGRLEDKGHMLPAIKRLRSLRVFSPPGAMLRIDGEDQPAGAAEVDVAPVLREHQPGDGDRHQHGHGRGHLDRHDEGEQRHRHQGFAEPERRADERGQEENPQHRNRRPARHRHAPGVWSR